MCDGCRWLAGARRFLDLIQRLRVVLGCAYGPRAFDGGSYAGPIVR